MSIEKKIITCGCHPYVNWFDRHFCEPHKAESKDVVITNKNLCDSCATKGCIFQSGVVRNHCDFYKAESEE